MKRAVCAGVLGLAAAGAGCKGSPAVERPSAAPRPSPSATAAPPARPAVRWFYYPQRATGLAALPLDAGATLVLGGATRFVLAANGLDAEASPYAAPEELTLAARDGAGFVFVDRRGGLYETDTPLGPLRARAPAPVPLGGLTFSGSTPVGLAPDGRLWSFERARGWAPASPAATPLFDFAATASGALLGLALPEELLVSTDRGASWQALAGAEPMGASALASRAGGVVVEVLGGKTRFWDGGALTATVPARPAPYVQNLSMGGRPSATQLARGLAVLDGTSYAELRPIFGMDGQPAWRITSAPLGERLVIGPSDLRAPCAVFAYAARGAEHALLCVGEDASAHLYRSEDGAAHFTDAGALAACARPELAVAPSGTALVTGCCLEPRARCGAAPDRVVAPPAAEPGPLRVVAAPTELRDCSSPAWSHDGAFGYAVCFTAAGARALVRAAPPALGFEPWLAAVPHALPEPADLAAARITLHPGPDGELGVAISASDGRDGGGTRSVSYALVEPSGRSAAHAFESRARLGAFGRHLVVVAPPVERMAGSRTQPSLVRESFDGGATLGPLSAPFAVHDYEELACGEAGCVFGDAGARAGWPAAREAVEPVEPVGVPAPAPDPTGPASVAPPALACRFSEAAWHDLGGNTPEREGSLVEVGFGDLAWTWVRTGRRDQTGIDLTYARFDDPGRATTIRLFESIHPTSVAVTFATVARGFVAVRLWAPKGRMPAEGDVSGRLEVAWLDAADGKTGRAALGQAGPFAIATFGPAPTLELDALGLDAAGVLLRPRPGDATLRILRDGTEGPATSFAGTPAAHAQTREREQLFTTDGGALQGVRYGQGAAVYTRSGGAPLLRQLAPRTASPNRAWAPAAPRPTLGVALDSATTPRRAYGVVLAPDGTLTTVPLATPRELGPTPRACSPEERRTAPGLPMGLPAADRIAVSLPELALDAPLALDTAIVCGTCAAAWTGTQTGYHEIVLTGDRTRGWVFRRRADDHSEWRAVECAR
ncbi:MAG: hypothetical protein IT373_09090 [Polyangiaceae bacterium]|nr:hypothetical protein [Polyangiaceae bacterium]